MILDLVVIELPASTTLDKWDGPQYRLPRAN
jgi:hypothetical protein